MLISKRAVMRALSFSDIVGLVAIVLGKGWGGFAVVEGEDLGVGGFPCCC